MCHLLEAFLLLSRVSRVGSRVRQHIFITIFFVFPPLLFWRSRMLNRRFTGESRKNRIVAAWIALGFSKSLQFHDVCTLPLLHLGHGSFVDVDHHQGEPETNATRCAAWTCSHSLSSHVVDIFHIMRIYIYTIIICNVYLLYFWCMHVCDVMWCNEMLCDIILCNLIQCIVM